jgi:NAD(P)-dependent dehydrogenase (short-subunit alcohol dehydrogenase family)
MELSLEGKVAVVTGASRGIGAAVADALAAEHAKVVIVARNSELLEAVGSQIRSHHGTACLIIPADLMLPETADQVIARVHEHFGPVDVLVNNAGTSTFGSFDSISDRDWHDAFELKMLGYIRMVRAVLPAMRSQGAGRIVNVIGMAGRIASTGYVLGAINASLMHLTRTLSRDLAPVGIVVKGINPGPTDTERMATALQLWANEAGIDTDAFVRQYLRDFSLPDMASPQEMARLIVLLSSPVSDRLIGTVLQADGGAAASVF